MGYENENQHLIRRACNHVRQINVSGGLDFNKQDGPHLLNLRPFPFHFHETNFPQ